MNRFIIFSAALSALTAFADIVEPYDLTSLNGCRTYSVASWVTSSADTTNTPGGHCTLHYGPSTNRWGSIIITGGVNRVRVTAESSSSFVHTLSGWYERAYFSGLGSLEPDHDLVETPIGKSEEGSRRIEGIRITGKTNLFTVCDNIQKLDEDAWRGGIDIALYNSSNYVNITTSYWSSTSFDLTMPGSSPVFSRQWAVDTAYTVASNFPTFNNLAESSRWNRSSFGHNSDILYALFPEDFFFGIRHDYYYCPFSTNGIPLQCQIVYGCSLDEMITNRFIRLERDIQGAANQIMGLMDRSYHPCKPVVMSSTTNTCYTHTRKSRTDHIPFDMVGITIDENGITVPRNMMISQWHAVTNYYTESASRGDPYPTLSDTVDLSSNMCSFAFKPIITVDGYNIDCQAIADELNELGKIGQEGVDYYVKINRARRNGSVLEVDTVSNIDGYGGGDTYYFPYVPTNCWIQIGESVIDNSYTVTEANCPEFGGYTYMPMDQAWHDSYDSVSRCLDLLAFSRFSRTINPYGGISGTNLTMRGYSRQRGGGEYFERVMSNKWEEAHLELISHMADRFSWPSQRRENYATIPTDVESEWQSSIKIVEGEYSYGWDHYPEAPGEDTKSVCWFVYTNGTWYVDHGELYVEPIVWGMSWTSDSSYPEFLLSQPEHRGDMRQRIVNCIDWKWGSVRRN